MITYKDLSKNKQKEAIEQMRYRVVPTGWERELIDEFKAAHREVVEVKFDLAENELDAITTDKKPVDQSDCEQLFHKLRKQFDVLTSDSAVEKALLRNAEDPDTPEHERFDFAHLASGQ